MTSNDIFALKKFWLGCGVLFLVAAFLFPTTALAEVFGMGDYPGGSLEVIFSISEPGTEAPAREYRTIIEPVEDTFDVTETVSSPGRELEDVSTGFGAGGGAGGFFYAEGDRDPIDLSPLTAIDDRKIDVQPNQNYILPDGGRLQTDREDEIAELKVVMGTFVHADYPRQRARIAFADRDKMELLLFPPLLEIEKEGEIEMKIELVEFDHQL